MNSPAFPTAPNANNVVTASDLVRHFGLWQERASRTPVYVLHRGRVRHVLTSIETMDALCAPIAASDGAEGGLPDQALLDLVDDMVVLVDRDLRIITASLPARRYFGDAVRPGQLIDQLTANQRAPHMRSAAAQVIATGHSDVIDIAAPYPGRLLSCTISPFPGVRAALILRDVTQTEELAKARGWARAKAEAARATGICVTMRINLRGYVDNPDAVVASFLGTDCAALSSVRFVGLVAMPARVAVGTAIEQVITTGEPTTIDAPMIYHGASAHQMRIGLAPVRTGSAIEGVAALLVDMQAFQQA